MADADPETFKTRYHLDLLDRLVVYALLRAMTASGATADQAAQLLDRRIEGDRADLDEYIGKKFGNPALTALYADEAGEVLDDMKALVEKLRSAMQQMGL